MTDFLNTQTGDITEFDDKLVRKLIEKVIVYDDRLMVEFKSGLEIEVKLQDYNQIAANREKFLIGVFFKIVITICQNRGII